MGPPGGKLERARARAAVAPLGSGPGTRLELGRGLGRQRRLGRGYSIWPRRSEGQPSPPEGSPATRQAATPSRPTLTRLPPPGRRALGPGARGQEVPPRPPRGEAHLPPSRLTLPAGGRLTGGLSTPLGAPSLPSRMEVWPRPGPRRGHGSPSGARGDPRQHLPRGRRRFPKQPSCTCGFQPSPEAGALGRLSSSLPLNSTILNGQASGTKSLLPTQAWG